MSVTPMNPAVPPRSRIHPQRQAEFEQQADQIVRAVLCMNSRHQIEAAAAADWEAGIRLLESEQPAVQSVGMLLLLQAITTTDGPAREAAGQLLAEMQPGP